MFTRGLSDLLLLAVGSLVVFVLREYILKVNILVSSFVNCGLFSFLNIKKVKISNENTVADRNYVREYTPTCRFLKIIRDPYESAVGVYSPLHNIVEEWQLLCCTYQSVNI
jgi:hypothetical protein